MPEFDYLLSQGDTFFYQFTDSDEKTLLIPKRNMATAMRLYQPVGLRDMIIKRLFPTFHIMPFVRKAIKVSSNKYSIAPEILSIAKGYFGSDRLEYSLISDNKCKLHRLTIQFFQGSHILGYGKVTENPEAESLFIKEHIMLDYLRRQRVGGIPEGLLVKRMDNGKTISLQRFAKGYDSYYSEMWTPIHEDFIRELAIKTAVPVPFFESDFYRNLTRLTSFLPSVPDEYKDIISHSLDKVHKEYGADTFVFSVYHGNFTARNAAINGLKLSVDGWENAELTYPPALDRYNFFMHQYIQKEMNANEIFSRIRANEWFDGNLFRCYLLDAVSRFVSSGKVLSSMESMRKLDIWIRLLSKL